jgi:hypothetical protein
LSETTTACTCTPNGGSCSATIAEHQRAAAATIVALAGEYDRVAKLEGGRLAHADQAAAASRAVWVRQGVDPASPESVGLVVVTAATYLVLLAQFPLGGALHAMSAAKLLTLSLPALVELARG